LAAAPQQLGESPEIYTTMGLFKPDLFRSLALGFVAGAVLVFSALGINPSEDLAQGVAPPAEAAPAR